MGLEGSQRLRRPDPLNPLEMTEKELLQKVKSTPQTILTLDMEVHTCIHCTQEAEAVKSQDQSHLRLNSKFQNSLGYILRTCLKETKQNTQQQPQIKISVLIYSVCSKVLFPVCVGGGLIYD